uniref:ANTP class homeobox transcription factor ANTP22 n=1 Tax=Mnemiopsis leidyi TaxID=27923 RepID=E3UJR8_MNELE|nr:ANTP class homeobox transcription factor ANTP22 [Mnemiopsis leidyi]
MGAEQSKPAVNFEVGAFKVDDNGEPYFQMGPDTLRIPMTLHREARENLSRSVRDGAEDYTVNSYMFFQGGRKNRRFDTDINYVIFRQFTRSQVSQIIALKAGITSTIVLYQNARSPILIGCSEPRSLDCQQIRLVITLVLTDCQVLKEKRCSTLYLMEGMNRFSYVSTSAPIFEGIENFTIDKTTLYPLAVAGRVRKTDKELDVIRYITKVSSEGHRRVLLAAKPGMMEYQASSIFTYYCYMYGGCREVGYIPICPSGDRSKILHYGGQSAPNDKQIVDGDLCLFDMGGEYHCYLTDITSTFPVNGKFTDVQRTTYEMVLDTVHTVVNRIRPGFTWREARMVCYRALLRNLVEQGLLVGSVDEMYDAKLHRVFMPHGIGHFIGGKFMVKSEIDRYRGIGGVRIEEMFANYCLNLSHIRQLQSLMDPSSSLSPIQTIEASVAEEEDRGSETPVAYLKERVRQNSELSADRPDSKKKKGARRTFTDEQVAKLENYFDYKRYFTPVERTKIAKELLLSETQIKTWFQNRRAKNKRDENERREQNSSATVGMIRCTQCIVALKQAVAAIS